MRFIPVILFLTTITSGFADMPQPSIPRVTVSASGRYFFTLLPPHWNDRAEVTREPFGVAYELRDDGSLHELWRVKGWYSFQCFLSDDGRYLVRLDDWPIGGKPSKRDFALAFYDRGKLLRQFSTADLVKDESKVHPSASHYEWFFRPKVIAEDLPGPEAPCYSNTGNEFILTTVDGISYTFDTTRGEVTATRPNPLPNEEIP